MKNITEVMLQKAMKEISEKVGSAPAKRGYVVQTGRCVRDSAGEFEFIVEAVVSALLGIAESVVLVPCGVSAVGAEYGRNAALLVLLVEEIVCSDVRVAVVEMRGDYYQLFQVYNNFYD